MIERICGAGLAAVMASFMLGCALDVPTQRMGINAHLTVGPDGKLSAPIWRQADHAAGPAPQGYYEVGNSIYSALQKRVDGGRIDPSWMRPEAGLFIEYGSDADMSLDNPRANIRFRSGYTTPVHIGSEQTISGGDPIDIWWSAANYRNLLRRLATDPLPLFSPAPCCLQSQTVGGSEWTPCVGALGSLYALSGQLRHRE